MGPRLARLSKFWAARSLAAGAVAVCFDLALGGLVLWFGGSTRAAAMSGNVLGTTLTYFFNRYFAFKDSNAPMMTSGAKFFAMQACLGVAHGQVVVWLRDFLGIPYVPAKMAADALVVAIPQLMLMRHVVFPKEPSPDNDTSSPSP